MQDYQELEIVLLLFLLVLLHLAVHAVAVRRVAGVFAHTHPVFFLLGNIEFHRCDAGAAVIMGAVTKRLIF